MQEFVDARKQPAIQNAPQVLFTNREPPAELRGVKGLQDSDSIGYITFGAWMMRARRGFASTLLIPSSKTVLSPRHFPAGALREETISLFQNFRDYLHYHIKCSKAYMHSRMRARVADWTKVLNRAKPEAVVTERKLARYASRKCLASTAKQLKTSPPKYSGRTFVRKV